MGGGGGGMKKERKKERKQHKVLINPKESLLCDGLHHYLLFLDCRSTPVTLWIQTISASSYN